MAQFKLDAKVLVITFPEDLKNDVLDNLMDDLYDDFPSSFIKRIIPGLDKIAVIVPENDVEGIKEFFRDFKIEENYSLYIEDD